MELINITEMIKWLQSVLLTKYLISSLQNISRSIMSCENQIKNASKVIVFFFLGLSFIDFNNPVTCSFFSMLFCFFFVLMWSDSAWLQGLGSEENFATISSNFA